MSNELKSYSVTIPITGYVAVSVKASNEKEAIEKAMEVNVTDKDIQEWSTHRHVTTGNVFHGLQNSVDVYEE